MGVTLPALARGDNNFELTLLFALAFVCFTGDVFAADTDLEEDFVVGFGLVIPVFTLSDLDVMALLGIAWEHY